MPITGITYETGRREAHLIANHAPSFISANSLMFQQAGGTGTARAYMLANTDVALTIKSRFKDTRGVFGKHGNGQVEVDLLSGEVTMPFSLGRFRPANFMIDVEARNLGTAEVFRTSVRVHLHRSIKRIWLSPEKLTVRVFGGPMAGGAAVGRFALRAEFDDDTVGDITTMSSVQWTTPPDISIVNGLVNISGTTASSTVISAFVPGLPLVDAIVEREQDWTGTQPPLHVDLVEPNSTPSGAMPFSGVAFRDQPNILFLSEGYEASEQGRFDAFVRSLVRHFKTDPLASPFRRLSEACLFWSAFRPCVPGRAGVSIATEVFTVGLSDGSGAFALDLVPTPEDIDRVGPSGIWSMEQLIHAVGLPMPIDDPVHTLRTDDIILSEWKATLPDDPSPHLGVNSSGVSIISDWRKLATRGLMDLVDSPFGTEVGRLQPAHPAHRMDLSGDRLMRGRLDLLLSATTSTQGFVLNTVWTTPAIPPNFTMGNADLVCFVLPTIGDEAKQDGALFCSSDKTTRAKPDVAGSHRYLLVPHPPPFQADPAHAGIIARQIAQCFTLGSERGIRRGSPDPALAATIQDERTNLQLESALTFVPGTGAGDDIRWRWHRIEAAAMLAQAPVQLTPTTWDVTVRPGQGAVFQLDFPVHLRIRRRGLPLRNSPFLSPPLWVIGINGDRITIKDVATPFTYPFTRIIATNLLATSLGPEDVMYTPSLSQTPTPFLPFKHREILSDTIRAHISSTGLPLTPHPMDTDRQIDQIPQLVGWSGFAKFNKKFLTRIVGLYGGGEDLHLGVFHPTGHCRMRDPTAVPMHSFCAVCIYQLIDQIDPQQHGTFDKQYELMYPKP